jgi:hypothetical protein
MKNTRLKEMQIVRYADDFRIFCRSLNGAYRTMTAVKQWLKERLRLDVSEEKTRVVNLKNQYSEFLGIKIRLKQKKGKLVVQSCVCDKAVNRIKTEAKRKVREIARPPNGKSRARAIMNYNAFVMGEHQYYQMATDVCLGFNETARIINRAIKRLCKKRRKPQKAYTWHAVIERYGESAQIRWLQGLPIAPIGYVQTKAPMFRKKSVQKYTPEGRKEIHANLGIDNRMLKMLLRQQLHGRTAEYADNRLSLYCAQYGKCAVTGHVFELLDDIHCHHKLPKAKGGNDNYQNLILVREDIHILIHATTQPTIDKYLAVFSLNKTQINKLNKLRIEAGNFPVNA